ncbi:Protein of unknown function [Cotesia congregata]|uniref:Integrase core domain-containing protein n=1 Tax=Cotesia congregata TaxID=51543 RepID=A0A8J2HAH4_COTCN|nr:Protein of unknown function [Cotesia congregata]
MSRESLITKYFKEGFTYNEIYHNISISRRHLIRILQKLGLKRKGIVEDSLESICTAVIDEIFSGGSCIGYKRMWQRLRLIYGLKVKRIEALQQSLRFYHDDSLSGWKSFIKGKSTSNQRIESYWSQLRRHGLDFWINLFKDLRERDFYNDSSMIHVECLRFCFGHLIRAELETIRHEWNRHRIRKQKNRHIAPGKPNCLYYLPEVIGAKNYMKPVNEHAIDILKQDYTLKPKLYNEIFCQLVKVLIPDIQVPLNVEESVELYLRILNLLKVYT